MVILIWKSDEFVDGLQHLLAGENDVELPYLLIKKNDVGLPYLVCRNMNRRQTTEVRRNPRETTVLPHLTEQRVSLEYLRFLILK